jgi:hypothetical protein
MRFTGQMPLSRWTIVAQIYSLNCGHYRLDATNAGQAERVMKLTILLALCLFYVATASAQTTNLTDVSDADNPFELSGTVSITNSKAAFAVQGKNVSNKDIILYRVELVGINVNDHDYYFQSHSIMSGDVANVLVPTALDINTMLQNPQALDKPQMRVIYVQFGDGTDWGDKTVGMSLRAKRPILTAALNSWLAAYKSGGDTALQEALGNEPTYFCQGVASNVLSIQARSGTTSAVAFIESRLDSAKTRQAAGIN